VRNYLESIEEGFVNSLSRINFIFKNEIITTECIKSHKGFKILGESFGPYEKGNKYKIKLFSAVPFIQNDILEIIPQEKCDNIDVQRYAISERDDQRLIQTNKFFLSKIKEFRHFMIDDIRKKKKPQLNLDRYNSYLLNIVDNRLLKLIKLAKTEISFDDERRLTASEKKLFDILFNVIKQWRNFFINNSL
jgi:hypothetical protein